MKRILLIILCLLLTAGSVYGTTTSTTNLGLVKPASEDTTVDWFDTMNDNMDKIDVIAGNIVYCSNYDHPDDAITAISSSNKTLLVTEAETCDNNFTVPANVKVRFERGGKWTINTGITVTFNGQIEAGLWQIFAYTGTGVVEFGASIKEVYPEWWDIDGTADEVQINAAIISLGSNGGKISLSSKTYEIDAHISIPEGVPLTIEGIGTSTILHTDSNMTQMILVAPETTFGTNVATVIFTKFKMYMDGSNTVYGIKFTKRHDLVINSVSFEGKKTGSGEERSQYFKCIGADGMDNCQILNCQARYVRTFLEVLTNAENTDDNLVANNVIQYVWGYGIIFYCDSGTYKVQKNVIANNTIEEANITNGNYAGLYIREGTHNIIIGNSVSECYYGSGIRLSTCKYNIISGNTCIQNGRMNLTEAGIDLIGDSDYNLIIGNTSGNSLLDTDKQKYGIDISAATCNENKIIGNILATNITSAINDSGTGTIMHSNIGAGDNNKIIIIADGDATPDISEGNVFLTSANTGATEITDLDLPMIGQIVTILGGSDTNSSTITDGGNFTLKGNWTAGLDAVVILFVNADNDYIELSRQSTGGAGYVDTSGTPTDDDWARFTDLNTIEGLSDAELIAALSLEAGVDIQAYSADNAFRTDKLSAFAATTSAELKGIISDETGTGALVFGTSPTFYTTVSVSGGKYIWGEANNYYLGTITAGEGIQGNSYYGWSFYYNTVLGLRIASNKVGIGLATPTARLHLAAGTATASTAPLKFTSGTLLTTPEAGVVEFLTDAYYGTITTGPARKQFAFTDVATLSSLTSIGTIGTGVWEGTAIADAYIPNNITIDLATLATTITVTDNEATAENNPLCFVADADPDGGSLGIETDGDLHYNPSTGLLTVTAIASALTGNATTCTTASAGDAAVDFFGAGVDAVTDATTCTDIEGTLLSIATGTLNAAIPEDHITSTMLKDDNAPADDDIVSYESTGTTFHYYSRDEVGIKFSKFDATSAPTVNNDITEGYVVGSDWFDVTADQAYACLDNTDGAAVWSKYVPSGGTGWIDTSGTPVDNDFAKFTDADTVEGRSYEETRNDLENYVVYPQDYATGAGTSGSPWASTCIEDAFAAASAGDTIYLRAGYYQMGGTLSVNKAINIIGEGINKTIIRTADAKGFYVTADYVTLKNLTVDGTAQANGATKYCIEIYNADYVTVENVELKEAGMSGIDIPDTNHSTFKNIYAHDNYEHGVHSGQNDPGRNIRNVYRDIYAWDNGYYGFYDRGNGNFGAYGEVEYCYNIFDNINCWDNTDIGIGISSQKGGVLSNSFASGNGEIGIKLYYVEDFNVHDCFTTLNGHNGIVIQAADQINCTNVIAKNNNSSKSTYSGIKIGIGSYFTKLNSCQSYDERIVAGDDIAFVDGGAGADTITQTNARFLKEGFLAGKDITITGAGQAGNNDTFTITSVVAGTITLPTASLTAEAAGAEITITHATVQTYGLELDGTNPDTSVVNCKLLPNATGEILGTTAGVVSTGIVNDDLDLVFGNDYNWKVQYDEAVDDQLLFITAGTAAGAVTDPLYEIIVGATPTANQQVFGIAKGTQASNTALFTVDEDGEITTGIWTATDVALAHGGTGVSTGAMVNFTSILNAALYVGRDTDNTIDFATDNHIIFKTSGTTGMEVDSTGELDMNNNSIGFTQQTVTYNVTTTTVDWTNGNKAAMTFGAGNIGTFAFTNPTNPCNVLLMLIQDGTGSRVVTAWDADIKWSSGGTAPTLSTAANSVDIISGYWNGTNYFCVASLDFQ